jgi:tetratricopeptide (TPR) repeat protein
VGEVFQGQGKLTEALAAFGAALAINQRLAGQDSSNAGWQLDLATAYRQVGGIFEAQGKLSDARAALEAASAIEGRLAELEKLSHIK